MLVLLVAFFVAAAVGLWIVRVGHSHAHRVAARDQRKPQRIYGRPAPRIGGIGVVAGLLCAAGMLQWRGGVVAANILISLLACAAPAFLVGVVQDLSDAVSPRGRLTSTAISAAMAFWWLGAGVAYTSIPLLDWVVATTAGSLALTVFSVAGIANAMNIIDGLNGLAAMCSLMMLMALAYVAYQVDDPTVGVLALAGIGAVAGFFIWNYPAGLLFLGDGGAYFLGFFVAELAILLLVRNRDEVSPLFPLLVCLYPVVETVFSIYRRWVLKQLNPAMPDGIHLHTLMYRRLMAWAVGNRSARALTRRNSMTSPYLWLVCMLSVVPAVIFWDNTIVLAILIVAFALSYVALYWRIVRFRTPRWMVVRR